MNTSIIIPVYNDERHIERAIRSCLTQTLIKADYEIIVIDDASTDSTPEILESWGVLPNIKVVTLKENMGVGYTCNAGIRKAMGQFVVRVDSDDYINEYMLEIQGLYLKYNKDMHAIACDYYKVDAEENIIERVNCSKSPISCGIMFRKEALVDAGLYRETKIDEEKDLFHRFVQVNNVYRIALPLYRYYQREGSLTHK